MTNSQLRHEFQRAAAYLGSLQACVAALENCGVDEPWCSAMRADAARLARSIQAAVADAERRAGERPDGWTVPAHQRPSAPEVWAPAQAS